MSVIILLILLAVLILAHEGGHFLAAKAAGIRVEEFGLGFPPRLASWRRGETVYSINLIPFGGFVKISGEEGTAEPTTDRERQLVAKPKWVQAVVLASGVTANLILAWLLLAAALTTGLPAAASVVQAPAAPKHLVLINVLPDSPAALAGLAVGDELITLTAGGEGIGASDSGFKPEVVQDFIAAHGGAVIQINYRRGDIFGQSSTPTQTLAITPRTGLIPSEPHRPAIGIMMEELVLWRLPLGGALLEGARFTGRLTYFTAAALITILGEAIYGQSPLSNLTGPIGLAGVVSDALQFGLVYLLSLTALISVNLAIINLFPLPALDGGRLLFLGIEAIKGSPIKPEVSRWLNTLGAALIILLMVVITYQDIARLF